MSIIVVILFLCFVRAVFSITIICAACSESPSGIKIFNNLPHDIKDLANETTLFWNALKRFLLINSFIIVKNILIIRDNLENCYQIESILLPLDF